MCMWSTVCNGSGGPLNEGSAACAQRERIRIGRRGGAWNEQWIAAQEAPDGRVVDALADLHEPEVRSTGRSPVLLHSWHRVRDGTGHVRTYELRRVATNLRALMADGTVARRGRASSHRGLSVCDVATTSNIAMHSGASSRDSNVEPINNHAERDLRGLSAGVGAVVARRANAAATSPRTSPP